MRTEHYIGRSEKPIELRYRTNLAGIESLDEIVAENVHVEMLDDGVCWADIDGICVTWGAAKRGVHSSSEGVTVKLQAFQFGINLCKLRRVSLYQLLGRYFVWVLRQCHGLSFPGPRQRIPTISIVDLSQRQTFDKVVLNGREPAQTAFPKGQCRLWTRTPRKLSRPSHILYQQRAAP